jgi:hypothetical protein
MPFRSNLALERIPSALPFAFTIPLEVKHDADIVLPLARETARSMALLDQVESSRLRSSVTGTVPELEGEEKPLMEYGPLFGKAAKSEIIDIAMPLRKDQGFVRPQQEIDRN